MPFIEQQPLFDQYDFTLGFDASSGINAAVGANIIEVLYCPSGPNAKRHLDGNAVVAGNPTTHYYGVMGPAGTTNPTNNVLGGITYPYTVGDAAINGVWSAHGMLSHFRVTAGSVSTNRIISLADVIDGTSNTLMVAERSQQLPPGQANDYRTWIRGNHGGSGSCKNVTYPMNSTFYNGSNNFNHISFGSEHPGGCNFALGDASVRFIFEDIDLAMYKGLASIGSGEVTFP